MRITIVGGCLTQQGNLPAAALYHQLLLARLAEAGCPAQLAVVRYERLTTCLAKVLAHEAAAPADCLIFHLRTEPLLRLIKLVYRYQDSAVPRVRYALNLPGHRGATHHNPLLDRPSTKPQRAAPVTDYVTPPKPRLGPELNAWLGTLIGNQWWAVRTTFALLDGLAAHAAAVGARLIVVGPPARPASAFEDHLARLLDRRAAAWAAGAGVTYVPLRNEPGVGDVPFFGLNNVHVSAAGHARIAALLVEVLLTQATAPPVRHSA